MERVGAVRGCGTTFHIVDITVLVGDDERALKLPDTGHIQTEICLQWHRDVYSGRYIDKRAARPDGSVDRRKLVVLDGHDGAEMFLIDLGVFFESVVAAEKDDSLIFQVLLYFVVNHLALVLGTDPGQELLFRLGDSQAVKGVFYVLGHVIPIARLFFGRPDIIVYFVKVEPAHIPAPGGCWAAQIVLVGLKPPLSHPVRFALHAGDLFDHLACQPLFRFEYIFIGVVEAILFVVIGTDRGNNIFFRHYLPPTSLMKR